MKSNLVVEQAFGQEVQDIPVNRGVLLDERIVLRSSDAPWRRITFRSEAGKQILFLTNEFKLEADVIAFLYLRRWDEEKCFDTWKNDFSQAKAWGKIVSPSKIRSARPSSPAYWWRCFYTTKPIAGCLETKRYSGNRIRDGKKGLKRQYTLLVFNALPSYLQDKPTSAPILEMLFSQKSLSDALSEPTTLDVNGLPVSRDRTPLSSAYN